jgi:hypothetical protein
VSEVYTTISTGTNVVAINRVALSTSTSSNTDNELLCRVLGTSISSSAPYVGLMVSARKYIRINAKTTYYLIYRADNSGMNVLTSDGASTTTVIYAECAYL